MNNNITSVSLAAAATINHILIDTLKKKQASQWIYLVKA